ncbi:MULTISPECIES: bile acid:sodium symporter [unclassified Synechococcus]|uniref:bile acid:sodium symporter n=1 Tax=unclassified Synechococcus TaxID=2626047 RepID=UPI0000698570|nr:MULTISPECIES: bile acid:sodium symporter [unclassified Synechococcus]EAQ75407.1 possible sodium dependent transporter [Synechococcus sp. WH 5701]WFN59884.1 bile acid:sodium symporter [Synechococcus sp. CCFWC 502]
MFVALTLFTIMFALGLGLRSDAIAGLRQKPFLIARVLVGSCLLVPLLALLLLMLPLSASLSGPARLAIALMALCPSAPMILRKAGKKGGDTELAALLQVGAALVAIVSIPFMADVFRAAFGVQNWDIGPKEVALQVGRTQVLPLLLGLLVRRWLPGLTKTVEVPLNKLANGLLLVLIGGVVVTTGPLLIPFVGANWLALGFIGVLVLLCLGVGYLLTPTSASHERLTVSLVTSMRNPGLALLFASTYARDLPGVKIAVVAYLVVTVLLSIPVLKLIGRSPTLASA